MYTKEFKITESLGNNAFSYSQRYKILGKAEIWVPKLISGTIKDVKIGDKIVFEEFINGEVKSFVGLKNLLQIQYGDKKIYIIDNHNHALYFWGENIKNRSIASGLSLIHIDQHTDMNDNLFTLTDDTNLFEYVNYKCNVGNFIKPAIQIGFISEVKQINTEYSILNFNKPDYDFILDIDLDFRVPDMGIEKYSQTINITKNLIRQAKLVTIATSPFFMDQKLALSVLQDLLSL